MFFAFDQTRADFGQAFGIDDKEQLESESAECRAERSAAKIADWRARDQLGEVAILQAG